MAASVRFETPAGESGKAEPSPAAHSYPLRSLNSQCSKLQSVENGQQKGKLLRKKRGNGVKVQRRKRVFTRKCGDISVLSRRRRVTMRWEKVNCICALIGNLSTKDKKLHLEVS